MFKHKLIWELGKARLELPATSRVLSVVEDDDLLWVWVESPVEDAPKVPYDFLAVASGHSTDFPGKALRFLASMKVSLYVTWHIFQVVDEPKAELSAERARSVQHLLDLTYTMECQIIQLAKDKAHFERELAITRREHSEAHEKNVRLEAGLQALVGEKLPHTTIVAIGRLLKGGWRCDHCKGTGEVLEADGMGGALDKECPVCNGYGIEEATTADDYTEY
jgi:hypothetical protein